MGQKNSRGGKKSSKGGSKKEFCPSEILPSPLNQNPVYTPYAFISLLTVVGLWIDSSHSYQILIDVVHVHKSNQHVATQTLCINRWTNSDKEHIINKLQKILMKHICMENLCLKEPTWTPHLHPTYRCIVIMIIHLNSNWNGYTPLFLNFI